MIYYNVALKSSPKDYFSGKTYIFKSNLELKKGDYVVVMTKYGYQLGIIWEKNEAFNNNAYSDSTSNIVHKLDGNFYEEQEKAEELQRIKKELDKKLKAFSKTMQYEALALHDNQAKEMLNRLRELNSSIPLLPQANEEDEDEIENPF